MTAAEALRSLQARARDFADVESRIIDLQRRTNRAMDAARERDDEEAVEAAQEQQVRLRALFERYRSLKSEWHRLTSFVPGLGVVPVVYAGAVVALAAGVVWILTRVDAEERIVKMLEDGDLDTDTARQLLDATEGGKDPFSSLASTVKWAAFAIGGYLIYRVWKDYAPVR